MLTPFRELLVERRAGSAVGAFTCYDLEAATAARETGSALRLPHRHRHRPDGGHHLGEQLRPAYVAGNDHVLVPSGRCHSATPGRIGPTTRAERAPNPSRAVTAEVIRPSAPPRRAHGGRPGPVRPQSDAGRRQRPDPGFACALWQPRPAHRIRPHRIGPVEHHRHIRDGLGPGGIVIEDDGDHRPNVAHRHGANER